MAKYFMGALVIILGEQAHIFGGFKEPCKKAKTKLELFFNK